MISTMVLNQNFWWILLIFQANALNAESDRKICGLNNFCDHWCIVCGFSIYLHFVVAPFANGGDPNDGDFFIWSNDGNDFICSKLPNEAGLKTTTATQGDSSWERNVPLWEPPVLNPYGSFLSLYGSSLHRGSFALNPYTGVFHPYTGVLRSMRCNSGTKFTPFALQTIPVDMYNTNTNTADNTSWYVQYQYQYDNTSWYVH